MAVTRALAVPLTLAAAGLVSVAVAVLYERRMQRHRRPGMSYRDVTLRRDGAWQRDDLFTPEGLALQRRAARYGWLGAALWVLALAACVALWVG